MPAERHCPECGAPILSDAPGSYCARCLLELGIDEDEPEGNGSSELDEILASPAPTPVVRLH